MSEGRAAQEVRRAGREDFQTRRQGEPVVVSLMLAITVVVALILGVSALGSTDAAMQALGLGERERPDYGAAIAAPFAELPIIERGAAFGFLGEVSNEERVLVPLRELNESGVSGEATLTASADISIVAIALDDERGRGSLPAFILHGDCDDLTPTPVYPLADAGADRLSMTTVDAALDELLDGGYSITILEQVVDLEALLDPDNRLACGEIKREVDEEEPVEVTVVTPTGVGTAARQATGNRAIVLFGLGAVSAALAGGGMVARRQEART